MSLVPNGALPKYILGWGVLNLVAGASCFINPTSISAIFNKVPGQHDPSLVALLSRTMGTLHLVAACIRLYAPYHMGSLPLYDITAVTFAIPSLIFLGEGFYWKSGWSNFGMARVAAALVAAGWMVLERGQW